MLVMAIAGVILATICSALAIDLGFVAEEARINQKVADLAALDAARAPSDAALVTRWVVASCIPNAISA
jgi:uncharacterized membrane protein